MADPLTPDEISRRVAALIANLQDELRRIDEKHGAERRAAIAASGLPAELVAAVLENAPLTSPDQYDQSEGMSQANSTNAFQRPVGKPLESKGAIAKHARRLRMSMTDLAKQIGVDHWNLRNWDKRNSAPLEVLVAIAAIPTPPKPAAKRK